MHKYRRFRQCHCSIVAFAFIFQKLIFNFGAYEAYMKKAFSPLRQQILDLVEQTPTPLSAHDIFGMIHEPVAFSTVYRGLWYLEEQNKIEGFFFGCAECGKDRFYISQSKGHIHFFHCEKCHTFTPIEECLFGSMKKTIEKKYGVRVDHHLLQMSGLCSSCRGK